MVIQIIFKGEKIMESLGFALMIIGFILLSFVAGYWVGKNS